MKFSKKVSQFLKSIQEPVKKSDEPELDNDLELEGDEFEFEGEEIEKSEEYADATEILSSLVGELKAIVQELKEQKSAIGTLEKNQEDLGEGMLEVAKAIGAIAGQPMPLKTAMAKSQQGQARADKLTQDEFTRAQKALTKAVQLEEITIFQSSRLETEMQKALSIPGYQMAEADKAVISRSMKYA